MTTLRTGSNSRIRSSEFGVRNTIGFHSALGLTLVEVLISICILAVGAVLLLQALARGAHVLAAARLRATAYAFAAAKMADIELAAHNSTQPPKTSGTFQQAGQRFEWAIQAEPLAEDPDLELVSLIVSWYQGPHRYESDVTMIRRAPKPVEQAS